MKSALREKYKQLRTTLTGGERESLSLQIISNLLENFKLKSKSVSVFVPIERFYEINTWSLIKNTPANFYLPVVQNDVLKHLKYESDKQLKINNWGIPEPQFGIEIEPHQFDFVLVPLLAYDTKGTRIGYGKGFYDGFLKDCSNNCKFIGLSYFEPEEKDIEPYSTDIPLHFCVTPKKIYEF